MKYKELQKLNEIIENLKAHPNADENIQFVLDLADNSVQIETLRRLIKNDEESLRANNETDKKNIPKRTIKGKGKLSEGNEKSIEKTNASVTFL